MSPAGHLVRLDSSSAAQAFGSQVSDSGPCRPLACGSVARKGTGAGSWGGWVTLPERRGTRR